jgi:hypothetical protein
MCLSRPLLSSISVLTPLSALETPPSTARAPRFRSWSRAPRRPSRCLPTSTTNLVRYIFVFYSQAVI